MSFCGFQSLSKMITVSAEVRLIPRPPARVERMKQKSLEARLGEGESFIGIVKRYIKVDLLLCMNLSNAVLVYWQQSLNRGKRYIQADLLFLVISLKHGKRFVEADLIFLVNIKMTRFPA